MPSKHPSIRVTLTELQIERLRELSAKLDMPQSVLVRTALRSYLADINESWPDDPDPPGQRLKELGGNAIRQDS